MMADVPHKASSGTLATHPPARGRTRRLLWIGVLGAVLAVVVVLSLAIGARSIPPYDVWSALLRGAPAGSSAQRVQDVQVVRDLRVPRTLLGLAVGAALALAGALMQAVTRNPLADPGLLGVSAGASLAIVLGLAVFGPTSTSETVWLSLLGAAAASALVYRLGAHGPAVSGPARLALAGAAVTAALLSVVRGVTLAQPQVFEAFRFWVVGSLGGRPLSVLWQVGPFLLVGAVLALGSARALNSLALGGELAAALGSRPARTRAVGAIAVVLLSGAATAAVGPIAFVGLTVPHGVRAFTGPDQRWLLPGSMLAGPVLLLGADIVGRVVDPPGEVQVGICVAVVGAPLFIALVRGRRLAGV